MDFSFVLCHSHIGVFLNQKGWNIGDSKISVKPSTVTSTLTVGVKPRESASMTEAGHCGSSLHPDLMLSTEELPSIHLFLHLYQGGTVFHFHIWKGRCWAALQGNLLSKMSQPALLKTEARINCC